MKKRMLALTLSAVMAASLFTGCGDKKDEPAASDKGGSTAAEVTGDFDWKRYEGTELNVLFSEHKMCIRDRVLNNDNFIRSDLRRFS